MKSKLTDILSIRKTVTDSLSFREKTLEKLQHQILSHLTDLFVRSAKQFDVEQKIKIARLLIKFQDIFAKNVFDLGLFNGDIKHRVHTEDAPAVRHRMRRTQFRFEKEEEEHLRSMLEKGVIQPSTSEWAASPVLVRKTDGGLRYCIDYRALNKVTRMPFLCQGWKHALKHLEVAHL